MWRKGNQCPGSSNHHACESVSQNDASDMARQMCCSLKNMYIFWKSTNMQMDIWKKRDQRLIE